MQAYETEDRDQNFISAVNATWIVAHFGIGN